MALTRSQRMADRMMDGQLEETLQRFRRQRLSWAAISRVLLDDFGIEVSPETLRERWAVDFGLKDGPNGSAA